MVGKWKKVTVKNKSHIIEDSEHLNSYFCKIMDNGKLQKLIQKPREGFASWDNFSGKTVIKSFNLTYDNRSKNDLILMAAALKDTLLAKNNKIHLHKTNTENRYTVQINSILIDDVYIPKPDYNQLSTHIGKFIKLAFFKYEGELKEGEEHDESRIEAQNVEYLLGNLFVLIEADFDLILHP